MVGVRDPELADSEADAQQSPRPPMSADPPRFLIVGAGARGRCYASAIDGVSNGIVAAVAEPVAFKRHALGRRHIWGEAAQPREGQAFAHWRDFLAYELERRRRAAAAGKNKGDVEGKAGEAVDDPPPPPPGVDGVFVCVLDDMHRDVVVGLAPLGLHVMCEKPLATTLADCLAMRRALAPLRPTAVFSVGHVLRYSPHNLMLRRLLVDQALIGHVNSAVHTEPVGWWHFAHSFVRGSWRNHRTSAPSLLTKSCHDIDLLLWLLCSPPGPSAAGARQGEDKEQQPHLPDFVSSSGAVQFFKKSRKPPDAGAATNCMRCPLGDVGCKYSAKHIYLGPRSGLARGNTEWPVDVVVPDIEDYPTPDDRSAALERALEEDWDDDTPPDVVRRRNWFGRCVFEADNNVCDDQFVTISWPESNRPATRVTFHMAAQTKRQCERFSRFYGEHGEIYADSKRIVVEDFASGETKTFEPGLEDLGHGGGDLGLTRQFVLACDRVKNHGQPAPDAQDEFIGCTLDDVIRSHALVFAAEEARLGNKVVDWKQFWDQRVVADSAAA
ncbi:oxidoreductase family, NAD-binding rossmann fold domain-containing protein [Hirsutella rhossiliensis]|uniref:Oxidoreductase family, NAD-binding rossmann fold domain-containing protein n=1 Tax=Hirsutella rhossiliensis TaxID=111463 RepID=A0A9P8MXV3_9HYPO|nr:oxidoreductase family, NAD-binding rossmann fold domain-containing protein [Hirsutella rhossiliensis]KAH0963332.1 oxidoreductase family, NAD-binding rossmann fold domain-containing protein [Hirsutella rhossiliensis]